MLHRLQKVSASLLLLRGRVKNKRTTIPAVIIIEPGIRNFRFPYFIARIPAIGPSATKTYGLRKL